MLILRRSLKLMMLLVKMKILRVVLAIAVVVAAAGLKLMMLLVTMKILLVEIAIVMKWNHLIQTVAAVADARGANCRKLGAMRCLKCGIWSAAKGLTTQHVDEKSQYKFQSQ